MSLKNAKDSTLDVLTNIVDAQYQGDPAGTPINQAHVKNNIATYIKDAAIALQPSKTYMVNSLYSSLGNPFFATIPEAVAQIVTDGSSAGSKAFVDIKHGSYTEALTLSHNGYVIMGGNSQLGNIVSGALTISNGIWVFKNIRFGGDINISGATVVFIDCLQTSGVTNINGTANVCVKGALKWGVINISGNNNNVFILKADDIAKDTNGHSIVLASGMTDGTYYVRGSDLEGDIDDATPLTENIGNNEGVSPLFTI